MKLKTIGLLSMAITCVAAISIGVSSCNNDSPTTPGNNGGVDHSKRPQVLGDNSVRNIGSADAPSGNVALTVNENGDEVVTGLNGGDADAITATFDSPITYWNATVNIEFAAGQGSLTYQAKDDQGKLQAQVDLKATDGSNYLAFPTFTSADNAGDPQYDVVISNNGSEVARATGLSAKDPITIIPDAACTVRVKSVGWGVLSVNSQCSWKIGFDPCCTYVYQLPDGTTYSGNQIKFIERNTNGVYVYVQTNTITTKGSAASATVNSSSGKSS